MSGKSSAGPSPLEERLIEAVARGGLLDLAGSQPVDATAMSSWGASRTIRAWVIRDIVRGRLVAEPDPRGLRLRGARIAGQVDLENVTSDLEVQLRDCLLPEGLLLRNARLLALGLMGCRIEQPSESTDPAIDARRFAAQAVTLADSTVTARSANGAVQLLGGHIGSQLDCTGARLNNSSGPALIADNLQVGQDMALRGGFVATGAGDLGAVRLLGAHIGGQLNCMGARLDNASGPALTADYLLVDGVMFLSSGFAASGAGDLGAIRLLGARIGGQLDCAGARLENTSGAALVADRLQVDQGILLRHGFAATGAGQGAVVSLRGARIGGALWLDTSQITRAVPAVTGYRVVPMPIPRAARALVELDGTTYAGLPQPASLPQWLRLLKDGTAGYAAQPYQQLAAAFRAAGHDREVRTILMAQRRDQIQSGAITGWDRTWARITGLTLGFGYQPWRALLLLLGVLALSLTLTATVGQRGGLAHTSRTTTPNAACSMLEQVGVGLDLGTPLLKTGARDVCVPTTTTTGQALTVAGWFLQILAWALAALFIAGFTGAVRKT